MLVFAGFPRNAARYSAWHPVRRQPSARQLCDAQRHADPTKAVGQASDDSGDDFGILVGVTAGFVPPAIDLTAKSGALHQDIFKTKALALAMVGIRTLWQFQLCAFFAECPFEGLLHAHHALWPTMSRA
jgi:hypothetical protein